MLYKLRIFFLVFALLLSVTAITQAQRSCSSGRSVEEVESGDSVSETVEDILLFCFNAEANEIWRFDAEADDLIEFYFYRPDTYDDNLGHTAVFGVPSGGGEITSALITEEGAYYLEVVNDSRDEIDFTMTLERLEEDSDGRLENTDDIDAYGLNNIGHYYWEQGDFQAALDSYLDAADLDPNDPVLWGNACSAAFNLGEYEEAIEYCDEALDIDDEYAYSLDYRGFSFESLGEYEEAIENYEELTDVDPNNPTWFYALGMANTLLGDTDEALDAFDEFVDMAGGDNVFAYYWRGVANLNAGNYDDALDDFEDSLESDNNHFYDYLWMSVAYQLNGDEDDAADALEDAISEMEDESDDFLRLRKEAMLALVTGDEDAAIEALESILEVAPLAHQRRADHFYLMSLTLMFPDEVLFADTLEWFRGEIGVD